jgi:hypothetical protein
MATEARAMTAAKRGSVRDQRKVVCSRAVYIDCQ